MSYERRRGYGGAARPYTQTGSSPTVWTWLWCMEKSQAKGIERKVVLADKFAVFQPVGVCTQLGSGPIMGLPGFEPGSRAPEAHSLDQASRQPHADAYWTEATKISVP